MSISNRAMPLSTLLTDDPEVAAAVLREGQLVAFPTETVYGLGADVFQPEAVRAIYRAKERPADNPLIVHLARIDQLDAVARVRNAVSQRLIDAFFPGPLTLVLPRHPSVPAVASAGLDTVAVRLPRHPVAQAFLEACATPVAAPSANRSGRPSPTTWEDVHADLKGRIACILRGAPSDVGLESTVVDCTTDTPLVLRPGGISLEQLQDVVPEARYADLSRLGVHRSPGLKYRHYAPIGRVVLVDAPDDVPATGANAYIGQTPHPHLELLGLHHDVPDVETYARALFQFFRRSDRIGAQTIYCQRVPETGLGRALMDRLTRAADTGD